MSQLVEKSYLAGLRRLTAEASDGGFWREPGRSAPPRQAEPIPFATSENRRRRSVRNNFRVAPTISKTVCDLPLLIWPFTSALTSQGVSLR